MLFLCCTDIITRIGSYVHVYRLDVNFPYFSSDSASVADVKVGEDVVPETYYLDKADEKKKPPTSKTGKASGTSNREKKAHGR